MGSARWCAKALSMRNLHELNINEGGEAVRRSPPSDREFQDFQEKTRLILPLALKMLLRYSNGGHPELNTVDGENGQFSVDFFYHLTVDDDGPESIWYAVKHWRPILGEFALPIAADGGGNQIYLDLAAGAGGVKICLHDEMRILELASTLENFIDTLAINPEMI